VLTKIIHETIEIDAKGDAICCQEISYLNNDDAPTVFKGIHEIGFHSNCEKFSLDLLAGKIVPTQLPIEIEPYQKKIRYDCTGTIEPNDKAKFILKYLWKEFRRQDSFERIKTNFDSLASYNVRIITSDDTFTGNLISVKDGQSPLIQGQDFHVTKDGHLIISRQHLNQNAKLDIQIIAKIKDIQLPVVNDIANSSGNCFNGLVILTLIHLLRDSLPFLHALSKMGVTKQDLFIVGIPYSSKEEVISHLIFEGYKVSSVEKSDYVSGFYNLVREVLKSACEYCKETGKRLLIIEDGGYAVPMLHDEFAQFLPLCIGAVEQTANGIWVDRCLEKTGKLSFPVMNVAESKIKHDRESPLVGKAIIENINRLLGGYGKSLGSQRVAQIGFGAIGRQVAYRIKRDNIQLTIFDIDEKKRKDARDEGFNVVNDLKTLFLDKTIIIGCSGQDVVGLDELRNCDRNVYFVNATSKLRELKYSEFLKSTDQPKRINGIGTEYKLKGGRGITIRLLADGFPVNFFGNSESIPDLEIQFIPGLLLSAAAYLIDRKIEKISIIPIPEELEATLTKSIELNDEAQ